MQDPPRPPPADDAGTSDTVPDEPETLGPPSVLDALRANLGGRVDPGIDLDEPETIAASPGAAAAAGASASASAGGSVSAGLSSGDARRYTVRDEIGRGGMGAILRVRDGDLRRDLAMKVLLGHAATDGGSEGMTRFLEEAQITSQLSHPGVVPVHELGIDATGQVFFTMSLVRGRTLGDIFELARAGAEGWDRTRALQALLRVCETMAYAHSRGVIHRDLKPANVMVGKFGEVYVMDWGLAKARGHQDGRDIRLQTEAESVHKTKIRTGRTDESQDDAPLMTMDGSIIGTPAYMPPEQAEGRIGEVDERSDVYSIGAMLYELLSGQAPYLKPGARMSPYTVLAAVTMGPPTPIAELAPACPGELIAIAEKAMARGRSDRYESAAALAEDLQRFISGHVVGAYGGGALTEARKWIARNPLVARTAGAAVLVLAVATAAFLWSLDAERDRALEAEARATDRAEAASRERRRAQDLADFMLTDLHAKLEPLGRLDVLHAAARKTLDHYRSETDAPDDVDRRRGLAKALTAVADVSRAQGDVEGARANLEEALAIRQALAEGPDAGADARDAVADVHQALAMLDFARGALGSSLEHGRSAVAIRDAELEHDPDDPQRLRALTVDLVCVARGLAGQGDRAGAGAQYARARSIFEQLAEADVEGPDWAHYLWTGFFTSGNVLADAGQFAVALVDFRRALGIMRELSATDPDHAPWLRDLSVSHEGVGRMHMALEDYEAARAEFDRALTTRRQLVAADPTNAGWVRDCGIGHSQLADALAALGRTDEALAHDRSALEAYEGLSVRDPDNLAWRADVAAGHWSVGGRLDALGQRADALASLRRAQTLYESLVGADESNAHWRADLEQLRSEIEARE